LVFVATGLETGGTIFLTPVFRRAPVVETGGSASYFKILSDY
jgi:hypothetical protein